MAPPPPSSSSRVAIIVLRFLTIACLFIALIVLATNNSTIVTTTVGDVKIRFNDVYAYRYMLATIVFGMAYTVLQIFFKFYSISTGNPLIGGDGSLVFDFYGDKVISYVLATGAAAGFGATKDLKSASTITSSEIDTFFEKGYASASLLLLAFLCTAILSVLSSYALPKQL